MRIWRFLFVLPFVLAVGCGKGNVMMEPETSEMLGEWVPDKRHSNCPPAWMTTNTVLVMKSDGACEVRNFGKGFFLQDYSSDYSESGSGEFAGKWQLFSEEGKWGLRFDFTLPTGIFRREARLTKIGKTTVIDFWIGWPDTSPRLVLQKSTSPATP